MASSLATLLLAEEPKGGQTSSPVRTAIRRRLGHFIGLASLHPMPQVARSRIELLAMNAVRLAEEARGCRVVDVSAQKCVYDDDSDLRKMGVKPWNQVRFQIPEFWAISCVGRLILGNARR